MKNLSIQTFTGSLQNQPTQLINARDLHQLLQVGKDFSTWIKDRIANYGFQENLDFSLVSGETRPPNWGSKIWGGQNKIDYHITLDMAKELCMLERSDLGQQARRYFIKMEKEALAARQLTQALPPVKNTVEIPTAKYIELLETQNQLLKQTLKPANYKLRLSQEEKSRILSLHQQGLSTGQIVKQTVRSESAVRGVIKG
ncbi:antirepressor [[Haemophilus] ducreyi]|uniref:Phage anti-repressor protein n=3 Tax=Haemophilus ducreyi TaxID=730 RepID=Q7VNL1_HAEDU|nr:phage antirepressor Ant [[Haemophilus] ducreyi]AAP95448.1 putative phage anti-repressor protein [[Haemophilus] ducreyi 35000HP]AKO30552.1 antirepressor [[Haemophilus] ducreyi]AKO31989.1 antirepressor [[Haemophilus] ducreyi]AKO33444.1 antirepressor [[Haemophilus] ducreyi]AKO34891.1 antirepressor [[Haemophilus] ducreyi]